MTKSAGQLSGTLSEGEASRVATDASERWGIVIAWSAEEPDRVGEVAPIPGGRPGPFRVLGRGGPDASDPHGRLAFARVRGRHVELQPPLASARLSRAQLNLRALGDGELEVVNAGKLALRHNDTPADRAVLRAGDTLQLGGQMLLLVVRRSFPPPGAPSAGVPTFPFGGPDADGIVGESPAAWALRDRIAFVGPRTGHVLVLGASGAGKELVARAVHAASPRAARPICARNASTLPDGIVDAELFGNARNYPNVGAPERAGLVGAADGTTLFLDEFGELPAAVQVHLLRVLDQGEYQRLGESRARRSTFRLVAATNRPASVLKEDMLARLTFRIEVSDLNARKEDVPLLARHTLGRILAADTALARRWAVQGDGSVLPRLSIDLARELLARNYTTHARELEAVLWRALEAAGDAVLETVPAEGSMRAPPTDAGQRAPTVPPPPLDETDSHSAETIQRCLDAHNGVIESAWRELGLSSRHALTRLIRKHRIEVRKRSRG